MRALVLAAICAFGIATSALAQEGGEEEIVVTGSRLEYWGHWPVPHVSIARRADFGIVEVEIRDDTRAVDARRNELLEGLNRLDASARRANMTLAIVDDEIGVVRPYTQAAAIHLMQPGSRVDSSLIAIRLRTAVVASDTLESIHDRVARLVDNTTKPGRVEMTVGDTDLSMVNLEQYREGMLRDILEEGRTLARRVGGANVEIGGLEGQVGFKRSGELDLILFLPYTLAVELAPSS